MKKEIECPKCKEKEAFSEPHIKIYFHKCGGFSIIPRNSHDAERFADIVMQMAKMVVAEGIKRIEAKGAGTEGG